MSSWIDLANTVDSLQDEVTIAIVGKYTGFADAYLSIIKVCRILDVVVDGGPPFTLVYLG